MSTQRGDNSYLDKSTFRPKTYVIYFLNVDEQEFVFPIPPSQVTYALPERTAVTQTLAGIHADDYGEGIMTIGISGSFGWGVDGKSHRTGKQTMAKLALFWQNRAKAVKQNDPDNYRIRFIDNQRGCVFECVMPVLQIEQNQQSPVKQTYQATFQVLKTTQLMSGLSDYTPIYLHQSQKSVSLPPKANTNVPAVFQGNAIAKQAAAPKPVLQIIHPSTKVQSVVQSNLVSTTIASVADALQTAKNTLPVTLSAQERMDFSAITNDIVSLFSHHLAGITPDEPILYQKRLATVKTTVQTMIGNLSQLPQNANLIAPLTNVAITLSGLISKQQITAIPTARPAIPTTTVPPLPIPTTQETPTINQYSLTQLAQAIYGSSNQAYLDALARENKLLRLPTVLPQKIPFIRVPDRNTLIEAPFDGTLV